MVTSPARITVRGMEKICRYRIFGAMRRFPAEVGFLCVRELRREQQWRHECPGCDRFVAWKYVYCPLCSWRGYPIENR